MCGAKSSANSLEGADGSILLSTVVASQPLWLSMDLLSDWA